MASFDRPTSVPKGMQATYDAVVHLTDEVCDRHLNAEYRELARAMTAALCRKRPSPLASGQSRTWACAILYELGRVNFLSDRASQPYPGFPRWLGFRLTSCPAFGREARRLRGEKGLLLLSPVASEVVRSPVSA